MTIEGLWFLEGKIVSEKERAAVWAAFDARWKKYYDKRFAIEQRHRKEIAALDIEHEKVLSTKPYTPWVGNKPDGPVLSFVKDAEREYKWRKNASIN